MIRNRYLLLTSIYTHAIIYSGGDNLMQGSKMISVLIDFDMWEWLDKQPRSKASIIRDSLEQYRKGNSKCASENQITSEVHKEG